MIRDTDPNQDVFRRSLGVLHRNVEVAIFGEDTGIRQLEFRAAFVPATVLFDKLRVRKGGVRVLVKVFHVGVSRSAVEIEIALLDILSMVAFVAGQTKEPFLKNGIAPVPQGHCKADVLMTVADARDSILVPAVRPRSRVVMREVLPGVAIWAVVLANGAPGTLAEVRTPTLPMRRFSRVSSSRSSPLVIRMCLSSVTTKAMSAAEYSPNSS